MSIRIFITGGTIDGLDYARAEEHPKDEVSIIPELLKQARVAVEYKTEQIFFKDSKFITDQERELMFQKCLASIENKVIITHGTATMVTTAKYLASKRIAKTIVCLGAALPANKEKSDALFSPLDS